MVYYSLRAACANCGVELCYGEDYKVIGVDQSNPDQIRVLTSSGVTYEPDKVVTANGAWMKEILPIAIVPHKGQSLSVTLRDGEGIDRCVILFYQSKYIAFFVFSSTCVVYEVCCLLKTLTLFPKLMDG